MILKSFNTQPPEGGWDGCGHCLPRANRFNTQPPEGGWAEYLAAQYKMSVVSTHSRPKAAGLMCLLADL